MVFTANGGQLNNSGVIDGGCGATGPIDPQGGIGVVGTGLTIVDSGMIAGGYGSEPEAGVVGSGGAQADAILFTGGTNKLTLENGYCISGDVVANSTADTLALGGNENSTFDVGSIGDDSQYRGFGHFEKTGTSTWNLTGSTDAVTSWQIDDGGLAVVSDENLGATGGTLGFAGGELTFLAGFTTDRTINLGTGGGTFNTNGYNAELDGPIHGTGFLVKSGLGTLTLAHTNNYSGGTFVDQGTLELDALGAAGTNTVQFGNTGGSTLQIDNDALASHTLANAIKDFNGSDVIDLAGLGYVSGATATYNTGSHVLTVTSGGVSDMMSLITPTGTSFAASSDGGTGTDIKLV